MTYRFRICFLCDDLLCSVDARVYLQKSCPFSYFQFRWFISFHHQIICWFIEEICDILVLTQHFGDACNSLSYWFPLYFNAKVCEDGERRHGIVVLIWVGCLISCDHLEFHSKRWIELSILAYMMPVECVEYLFLSIFWSCIVAREFYIVMQKFVTRGWGVCCLISCDKFSLEFYKQRWIESTIYLCFWVSFGSCTVAISFIGLWEEVIVSMKYQWSCSLEAYI